MNPIENALSPVDRIRALCLALPEVEEKPFGGHTAPSFRVRDKIFVTVYEDHSAMTLKASLEEQQALIASNPDCFFVPPYVGHHGWIGVRLTLDQDWSEIGELIEESYRYIAPKRLVSQLASSQ